MKLVLITAMLAGVVAGNAAPEQQKVDSQPTAEVPDKTAAPPSPLVVRNSDGTFTIRKEPAGNKDARTQKGLVIRPQVVIPIVPAKK
jgi:hypothetical protein